MIGSLPVFFSNFKNKLLRTVRYYMLPRLLSGGEKRKIEPSERSKAMSQQLNICVSSSQSDGYVASVRCVSVRERILRFLFGSKNRLTIIVPGETVEELAIHEIKERST